LAFYVLGGISILGLAVTDWWKRKDADSLLLALWVLGTFVFVAFLNWTINARSVLPLIPAVGILLARRIDTLRVSSKAWLLVKLAVPLAVSGALSVWIASADAETVNSARLEAASIPQQIQNRPGRVIFQGHWGFQYYMEALGFTPLDVATYQPRAEDLMVIPMNNANTLEISSSYITSRRMVEFEMHRAVTPMRRELGAGFYSSTWGPLPFAIGYVPPERYMQLRLAPPANADRQSGP
jgi:hypothetical protein